MSMPSRNSSAPRSSLYTPQQRARRDASPWTRVQAVLAPLQFLAFAVSLALVLRYLASGQGASAATVSIIVKTGLLYAIMLTGCFWERDVFGRYLFARAFFWEDLLSLLVLALHTTYIFTLLAGALQLHSQMYLALAAYAAYLVNATQYLVKLRSARRERAGLGGPAAAALDPLAAGSRS